MQIHQQFILWQASKSTEEGACSLETTVKLVHGPCTERFIPSPAPCRVPSHQVSTFGLCVEERIYPWMPSQLHSDHYKSLLFTRDKLQRFIFCASPQASTLCQGSRNNWDDKLISQTCARQLWIQQWFKRKQTTQKKTPTDIQMCFFSVSSRAAGCKPRVQSHRLLQNYYSQKLASISVTHTCLHGVTTGDISLGFEIQFWAHPCLEVQGSWCTQLKHTPYLKQNTF